MACAKTRPGHLQCCEWSPAQSETPESKSSLPAGRLSSREDQNQMKKIALIAFLLTVCVAAGRAQESRQDISLSGTVLVEPFIASSTNVQVHSNRAFGALVSYRYMLTPNSAVEANYGITYQNKINYQYNGRYHAQVLTRTQEMSAEYVRSFTFRKYNPFVEAGPGVLIFQPIRNMGTTTLDVKKQMQMTAFYGAGIAREISPSFDIRAEFRGAITKVPTFNEPNSLFTTNKWYNIYMPVVGVAYHF
jgi:opacity protein-like surface antigen